jgi:hypothetical protein
MAKQKRNPRVYLALKPNEYDVVKRLAVVTGTTMAKALHGQIEAVVPMLEKVVESLEAARAKLLGQAMQLHSDMDQVAARAMDNFDLFATSANEAAAASGTPAAGLVGQETSGGKSVAARPNQRLVGTRKRAKAK